MFGGSCSLFRILGFEGVEQLRGIRLASDGVEGALAARAAAERQAVRVEPARGGRWDVFLGAEAPEVEEAAVLTVAIEESRSAAASAAADVWVYKEGKKN